MVKYHGQLNCSNTRKSGDKAGRSICPQRPHAGSYKRYWYMTIKKPSGIRVFSEWQYAKGYDAFEDRSRLQNNRLYHDIYKVTIEKTPNGTSPYKITYGERVGSFETPFGTTRSEKEKIWRQEKQEMWKIMNSTTHTPSDAELRLRKKKLTKKPIKRIIKRTIKHKK